MVVVSIDGMMPDVYQDPDAHHLKVPTLRALVARGASGRVKAVMPTVTYPSHTTMVTGVPPRVHGIVSNKPLDPLGTNFDGWRWYAEDIAVPTVYQAVEADHRTAALIMWPVTVGAHASYVVPEYWRAGGPDDQKLVRALSTPGALDDMPADLWTYLVPPDIKDHAQFEIAQHVLATRHPDLMMVHAFTLDDMQHDHGPWSPEAVATLEAADRELGELVAALPADTTLLVVSDHGFAPIDHEIRPLVTFMAKGLVRDDGADVAILANGGTAFVYVLDASKRAAIDAALGELSEGVERRIEHDELVAQGGDPKAAFALVARHGYGFSDKRKGDPIMKTDPRGTHGWPPDDPAMASSFIAVGPHIPHAQLGNLDMVDIAPTIARWLDVPLPTATGKPIAQVVE